MIKIDRVPEISDAKTSIVEGYKSIEPLDKLSDKETADYISKEFAKAHEEMEMNTEDRLLSEAFGRSEDEISIDFEISDSLLQILDAFHDDSWGLLDIQEQVLAIKRLVNTLSGDLELEKIPEVLIKDDEDDAYGFYDEKDNTISLNGKYLNNGPELVDTIAHELRHAYQHMRAEKQETWEDALYKVNFENYISPIKIPGGKSIFITDYQDQYVEVDASAFANLFSEAIKV